MQHKKKIKDYFESIAPTYTKYSKKGFRKWLRLREEIVIKQSFKTLPLGDVLELGSGTGYYSRYIYKQGATSISESILSKIPPCPRKIVPESLTFSSLFIMDSRKSPNCPITPKIILKFKISKIVKL